MPTDFIGRAAQNPPEIPFWLYQGSSVCHLGYSWTMSGALFLPLWQPTNWKTAQSGSQHFLRTCANSVWPTQFLCNRSLHEKLGLDKVKQTWLTQVLPLPPPPFPLQIQSAVTGSSVWCLTIWTGLAQLEKSRERCRLKLNGGFRFIYIMATYSRD